MMTNTHYMNIHTGSVDTLGNWLADFDMREDREEEWADWQSCLVEVVRDHDGEWIEIGDYFHVTETFPPFKSR